MLGVAFDRDVRRGPHGAVTVARDGDASGASFSPLRDIVRGSAFAVSAHVRELVTSDSLEPVYMRYQSLGGH
jgi:hypothetical protein